MQRVYAKRVGTNYLLCCYNIRTGLCYFKVIVNPVNPVAENVFNLDKGIIYKLRTLYPDSYKSGIFYKGILQFSIGSLLESDSYDSVYVNLIADGTGSSVDILLNDSFTCVKLGRQVQGCSVMPRIGSDFEFCCSIEITDVWFSYFLVQNRKYCLEFLQKIISMLN